MILMRETTPAIIRLGTTVWSVRTPSIRIRTRITLPLRNFDRHDFGREPAVCLGLGSLLLASDGECILVDIADTGPGIPEDIRARVFEPFFTTKDVGKGSGLGLSQVYGFVRQSSGDVVIHSAPGQGTRVVMRFPRAGAP